VRGSGGMTLTPRAKVLSVAVHQTLSDLATVLREPDGFDPATSQHRFQIATNTDVFEILALESLLQRITKEAPGVDIEIMRTGGLSIAGKLESGDVDVLIGVRPDTALSTGLIPDSGSFALKARSIFKNYWACLARYDHPRLRNGLDLETYADLPHILVSPGRGGHGFVDRLLESENLSRRVALRIPSYREVPVLLENTDLIVTVPDSLVDWMRKRARLKVMEPPVTLSTDSVSLLWHERYTADPAHQWFRDNIVAATTPLRRKMERSLKKRADQA
jgi:DNA-binding transcriptional LysR family regulator